MKPWRWFVGQVARLRRSIVGVFGLGSSRRRRADEDVAALDEPRAGPPEHWVERVRRGAPGLLEPSLRRRGRPGERPVAERIVPSETGLEPLPAPVEPPKPDDVPEQPRVAPRRPEAPEQARLSRRILRRKPSGSTPPPAVVEATPAPAGDDVPSEPAGSPPAEPPLRRRPPRQSEPPQQERSPAPPRVVELEAPQQPRPVRVELAANTEHPIRARSSHPSVANVDEIGTKRMWSRAVPPRARRREPHADPLPEPTVPRPASQETSAEPGPAPVHPADRIPALDHPWPDLPPPLDHGDTSVETALRAWEHRRRIDREQTRL